ncbi:MAG: hypothetical protein ACREK2_01380 [Gemmatimonadota bacterium]
MSRALAAAAVLAWAVGAVAIPVAAWLWFRAGRRRLLLIAFAGGLVAELSWLASVAADGLDVLLNPRWKEGLTGWAAWAAGVGGLAALVSGLNPRREPERGGGACVRDPDPAVEIGVGLFGLGILLRQLALTL